MSLELLVFTAEWCGSCGSQKDILDEYDATPMREIDVDEDPDTANDYGVRGLPTLILIDDGEVLESWNGITQLDEIESAVERHS